MLSLSKEEFLQNQIILPREFYPLHHKHKFLMDATPFKVLCPRCSQQLGWQFWWQWPHAHVLSTCLFAKSMACLPDLRLIGTRQPAPPWLHVTVFRGRQEVAAAQEDCSLLPGELPQGPSVVLPSNSECTYLQLAPHSQSFGSTALTVLGSSGYGGRHNRLYPLGYCSLGPLGFQPPRGFLAHSRPHCPRQEAPEKQCPAGAALISDCQNLEF